MIGSTQTANKLWKRMNENRIAWKVHKLFAEFLQRRRVLMQYESSFLQESSCHRDSMEAIGWKPPARRRSRTIWLLVTLWWNVVFKNECSKVVKGTKSQEVVENADDSHCVPDVHYHLGCVDNLLWISNGPDLSCVIKYFICTIHQTDTSAGWNGEQEETVQGCI